MLFRRHTITSTPRTVAPGAHRNGVHALAIQRQLAWAHDFALAGDLASALDALGDAEALAQELGRRPDGAGTWPSSQLRGER